MNKTSALVCLVPVVAILVGWPAATMRAQSPVIPVPEKASEFLDPVEMILRSAPASALRKLRDDPAAPGAAAELNRYFGQNIINKSIVVRTTVEAAQPRPDVRNAFRIRAASVPLEWDGGTMKRLSWLYFQEANAAAANSVKVGAEITVTGWVRRCEVVMTPEGLRLNFDLQHTRIENSVMPLAGHEIGVAGGIGMPVEAAGRYTVSNLRSAKPPTATLPPATPEPATSIVSPQILDCVKRLTGLDASSVAEAERVSLSELNIPFLSAQLRDETGIRVRFAPGKIHWSLPYHGREDLYARYFTVYLDAEAKRILAVTSHLAERSPDIHAELSPEEAEKDLRLSGAVYQSFPTVDPNITFLEALETVRASGYGYPPLAQEIDGFYVMYALRDQAPRPVWIINLRGLPPFPFHRPFGTIGRNAMEPPAWKRNYARNIVDAISGKWIIGANGPGPT
ncbi:MAG: hypothetical protein WDN28_07300 [Chthoniobacter sp.]